MRWVRYSRVWLVGTGSTLPRGGPRVESIDSWTVENADSWTFERLFLDFLRGGGGAPFADLQVIRSLTQLPYVRTSLTGP
ncbi:hypothetical protein M2283_008028 [Streptomyces pseudovenezuelae]|uniref:Uncharacterized protein n=1 Tax=Streptomyces pseudovenezuelae TaxID=67350 RepID=A0ABT6LWJ0_9ACTN|nr:hypothetical protein [Streptomyces pseudovenezuelae]